MEKSSGWRVRFNRDCSRRPCRKPDGSARRFQFTFYSVGATISMCAKLPSSWTAVVADVSGKGVGSALLASLLQALF